MSPYTTGRGDRGGGGTVEDDTVGGSTVGGGTVGGGTRGTWRPWASAPQTVMIDKERWFSSHTLSYQLGETQLTRDPCMRCRDVAVRTTVGKPLGQRRPMGGSRPRG